ncbi:MAG: PIN domain-containing protein [Xenococcus sp. (in: cyanobacteria)]
MNIILDACAVIAFFQDEEGGDVVEGFLMNSEHHCYIHVVNLCEVYYDFIRRNDQVYADQMVNELKLTGVTFEENLETPFWKLVGQYKANIARISLADCFALALTTTLRGTLLTSDHHEFDRIVPLEICPIAFIR